MQTIWEYLFPATIMAIFCAAMASNRGKNPLLWFVFGIIGNFIAVIIIGGYAPNETKKRELAEIKLTGTLIAASICMLVWGSVVGLSSIILLFNSITFTIMSSIVLSSFAIILGINLLRAETWALKWSLGFMVVIFFQTLLRLVVTQSAFLMIFVALTLAGILLLLFNKKMVFASDA